jgi:lipoprotein-releasing system permease protein
MYKLLLIRKYLFKRRIAWVSLAAVMMCVAMVLVVISVMGGWLRMFEESFRGLSGDVIVQGTMLTGFPNYEKMIEQIEKLPDVEAAVPLVSTFGVINIDNQQSTGVRVLGIQIDKVGRVNDFPKSLYRQYKQLVEEADDKTNKLTPKERDAKRAEAEKMAEHPSFALWRDAEEYRMRFPRLKRDKDGNVIDPNDPYKTWPGMIAGIGVLNIKKNSEGKFEGREDFLYHLPVYMTMPRIEENQKLASQTAGRNYFIVDDSRTNLWQYDASTVYVPFEVLQKDLGMDGKAYQNIETGQWEKEPARANEINIKVKPGKDINAACQKIKKVVLRVQGLGDDDFDALGPGNITVETWRESQAVYLGAIENEKSLVTTLFGFISLVAVFLIFCIFYMIVVEKTRDIGIVKSVGGTSAGVATIFLGYGTAIGIVGGLLGIFFGWAITHWINEIHSWLGHFGIVIWKPEVYAFDTIPNVVSPVAASVIFAVAVVSSVVGALVPAIRAARLNPVEALRWE